MRFKPIRHGASGDAAVRDTTGKREYDIGHEATARVDVRISPAAGLRPSDGPGTARVLDAVETPRASRSSSRYYDTPAASSLSLFLTATTIVVWSASNTRAISG